MTACVETVRVTPVPHMEVWVAAISIQFAGMEYESFVFLAPLSEPMSAAQAIADTGLPLAKVREQFLHNVPLTVQH